MFPVPIEGETRNIGKPLDWDDERDGFCDSLSVADTRLDNGHNCMVSAWQPTPYELKILNEGGYVYIGIIGTVHPVISLYAQ